MPESNVCASDSDGNRTNSATDPELRVHVVMAVVIVIKDHT